MQLKINIPLAMIWMEVNIFGKTILPELFWIFILWIFLLQIIGGNLLCMKLILKIKEHGMVMGNM